MKTECIDINGQLIGHTHPVYIIAEMSGNHNQCYEKAVEILHAVKECGANAIKLQTYTPDTLTIPVDNQYFRIGDGNTWAGQTLYELYSTAYTPWEWLPKLKEEAGKIGLTLFSTPYDTTAVDFLVEMNVPAYKIASFELVDIPLIQYIASKGKPIIMSTGMGTLREIDEAVNATRQSGNEQLVLLKCVSDYPASPDDMNLRTIPNIMETFGVPVGLSDHSIGHEAAVAAVALGVRVIEKHVTFHRQLPGPDHEFAMTFEEFGEMIESVRNLEKSLGDGRKEPSETELARRYRFRLGVYDPVTLKSISGTDGIWLRPEHHLGE